jgi:hypothetical protein
MKAEEIKKIREMVESGLYPDGYNLESCGDLLRISVEYGHIDLVRKFIDKYPHDDAFIEAAKKGHSDILDMLNVSVKTKTKAFKAAFDKCQTNGPHISIMEKLLQFISQKDINKSLLIAASEGCEKSVFFLINSGADINYNDNYALKWASRHGHTEVVKLLLEHDIDKEAIQKSLQWAVFGLKREVIKLLCERGAILDNYAVSGFLIEKWLLSGNLLE